MKLLGQLAALLGILGTGITYGTDVFSALVQRPALARVDDAVLTAAMGNVHRYGDRRIPTPSIIGLLAAAAAALIAALGHRPRNAAAAGTAVGLWAVWLTIYFRISAPINKKLTAAADRHETPDDARAMQHDWDRVITLRATLLGTAVAALGTSLVVSDDR